MSLYAVVDATGATLDTFGSWASAARFQSAWERQNLQPATVRPHRRSCDDGSTIENSRPVVALIRLIGWATSAPSRKAAR